MSLFAAAKLDRMETLPELIFKSIIEALGTEELKNLRQCNVGIRDRIDDHKDTFNDWVFHQLDCSSLEERILGIRTIEGITVHKLRGNEARCDEVVETLVKKHPELKAVEFGDWVEVTDRGLRTLLTADGLTKLSLSRAMRITGDTLGLRANSARHLKHLALMRCSLTDREVVEILHVCGIQLTSLDLTANSEITGERFCLLQGKFINMEKLCVDSCISITPKGLLEVLGVCGSKLQTLDISRTNITGQGLEELHGKFVELKALNLTGCRLTDIGLLNILRMCGGNLQDLDISKTKTTGTGLDDLQGKLGGLKTLSLEGCSYFTDQGLFQILRLCGKKLLDLNISNTRVNGPGLDQLQEKLEDLKTLDLCNRFSLTDQGLLQILKMCGNKLRDLSIYLESLLTGEGLDELQAKFPEIKTTKLHCKRLTDQGLLQVLRMCGNKLQKLHIVSKYITGQGLDELQGVFGEMMELDVQHCTAMTNQGLLKMLSMCGNRLQCLNISETNITGEGLEELQGKFAALKTLNLRNCWELTDQGLLQILKMCGENLQELNLSNTRITGQGLEELQGKFAGLKTLNLQNSGELTDQGLLQILKMCGEKLQELNISCTWITGQELDELQGMFLDLKTLDFKASRNLTDQGMSKILRMCGRKLQYLDISILFITGEGAAEMRGMFPEMKTLNLYMCFEITDQGLLEILRMCGSKLHGLEIPDTRITGEGLEELQGKFAALKTLNLRSCSELTDQGLLQILKMCGEKLQELNISNTRITGHGLEELQGKFPYLEELDRSRCSRLKEEGLLNVVGMHGS